MGAFRKIFDPTYCLTLKALIWAYMALCEVWTLEDLTKVRNLSPDEVEKMREEVKRAAIDMLRIRDELVKDAPPPKGAGRVSYHR